MYQLICTSYNETVYGLILRNNWIEPANTEADLQFLIKKWRLRNNNTNDCDFMAEGLISNILCGNMAISVAIHVRVIKFG